MAGGDGLTLPDVTFSTCSAVEASYPSCSIAGIKRLADVQALGHGSGGRALTNRRCASLLAAGVKLFLFSCNS